jgi:large subunit ribosomal protein L15
MTPLDGFSFDTRKKISNGVKLGDLPVPKGANRRPKRRGCGESSGHGKTSGKGHKGQNARSGPGTRPGFEGGQMPLIRRLPKRGFNAVRPVPIQIVNVKDLNRFPAGSVVDPEKLAEGGLVETARFPVKVLGEGKLAHSLTVKAHRFSKSAQAKISAAGGSLERLSSSC